MYKHLERFMTEEEEVELGLSGWVWNSHYWVELTPGNTKCKWCGRAHTDEVPIDINYPLCFGNPIIKALLSNKRDVEG